MAFDFGNFSITPCVTVRYWRDDWPRPAPLRRRGRTCATRYPSAPEWPAAGHVPGGCSPWRTLRAQGPYGCGESSKKCCLHGVIEKLLILFIRSTAILRFPRFNIRDLKRLAGPYSGPLSQDTNFPNLRYSLLCVAYCFNPAYSVAARGGPVVKRWTTSLFVHRLTTGPQVSRRPAGRGHKYTGCPSSHQFQRWDTVVHFCWRHPMETLVRPLVVVQLSNSTPIIPKHDQSAILGIPGTIRRSELVNENETLMTLI